MAYEPTEWKSGDVVTSAKLNKLERGVADASNAGGLLIVKLTNDAGTITADKTWQEIHDADFAIFRSVDPSDNKITHFCPMECIYTGTLGPDTTKYYIDIMMWEFSGDTYVSDQYTLICDDPDEYPALD